MRISEITSRSVRDFIRVDDECDMKPYMDMAKAYIKTYTGMTDSELDEHDDLWLAFMVLCQDAYDNRSMYIEKGNVNIVVESILSAYSKNLLPEE